MSCPVDPPAATAPRAGRLLCRTTGGLIASAEPGRFHRMSTKPSRRRTRADDSSGTGQGRWCRQRVRHLAIAAAVAGTFLAQVSEDLAWIGRARDPLAPQNHLLGVPASRDLGRQRRRRRLSRVRDSSCRRVPPVGRVPPGSGRWASYHAVRPRRASSPRGAGCRRNRFTWSLADDVASTRGERRTQPVVRSPAEQSTIEHRRM